MGRLYPLFMGLRFAQWSMSLRDRFRPAEEAFLAPKAAGPSEAQAAQALSANRGRMSVAPPPSANKAVAALLKPILKDTGLGLAEVKRRWREIAGEAFARATPVKLSGGTLTLHAPSALAPFLQQQIPLLLERLRTAGAKARTIRIDQRAPVKPTLEPSNVRPLQKPLSATEEATLAQALDPACDPGLRSALLRLGRAVKQG
ncbi:MAG: DciA family protein [Caulobacteraceae bacterium]